MLKASSRRGWLLALALVGLWPVGTSGTASAAGGLMGAGATFPYPLYSKWIWEYEKQTGVKVNYQPIGSGGGIQQLRAGTVDFGASDAPLSGAELETMPGRVLHVPTVAGAVAVVYNLPGFSGGLRLTPDVLADIYLAKILRWNDRRILAVSPRAKLPALPIAVVHRSDGSGTTDIFTRYLSAGSKVWSTRVGTGKSVAWPAGIGGKGNEGVAGLVKQIPGAIGYLELAYAKQNMLACASLRNRAGKYVEPSLEATAAAARAVATAMKKDVRVSLVNAPGADAYPIAGLTFLLVYQKQKSADKGKALVAFLRWASTTGQKYAGGLFYAPLPTEVVKINEAVISSIR